MKLHLPFLAVLTLFPNGVSPAMAQATTPRDMLFACMEGQRVLPPALRAATCMCFVERAQTVAFRIQGLFASGAAAAASRANLVKECLAAEHDMKPGTSARMLADGRPVN